MVTQEEREDLLKACCQLRPLENDGLSYFLCYGHTAGNKTACRKGGGPGRYASSVILGGGAGRKNLMSFLTVHLIAQNY